MKSLTKITVNLQTSEEEIPCESYVDPKVPGLSLNRPVQHGSGGKAVIQPLRANARGWMLTHAKSGLGLGPEVDCRLAVAVEFLREVGKIQNWDRSAVKVTSRKVGVQVRTIRKSLGI